MQVFVFDTETTGLPVRGAALDKQPYIVQFAGILAEVRLDGTYTEIERVDELIRPPIAIPFTTSQVHGIYDKDVADKPGFDFFVETFLHHTNTPDIIVGHNIEFDERLLCFELERHGREGYYQPKEVICTMRASTEHCQLQGRGFSHKPPKLNELYKKLFGERFTGAHNAMVDVEATLACFVKLVELGVIRMKTSNVMSLF